MATEAPPSGQRPQPSEQKQKLSQKRKKKTALPLFEIGGAPWTRVSFGTAVPIRTHVPHKSPSTSQVNRCLSFHPTPQTISVSKTLDNLNKNKFLPIIRPQFLVHPPQRRQRLQVRELTRSFKFGANFFLNLKKTKKLADFFLQKIWLVENESVPKGEAKEPADEKSAEKLDNGRNCRWKKRRLISFSFTE